MPVLDDVADAGRRAGVVLQHHEPSGFVTDDIGAAHVHIRVVTQLQALHHRLKLRMVEHEVGRQDAVADDFLRTVQVGEQQIESRHPLHDTALDVPPIGRRQDARDYVERQDAVDRVLVRIDSERDTQIV